MTVGELSEGMRNREIWAYVVGIGLSVAGGIGSVVAFEAFGPALFSPSGIRWLSLIVFGGAGIAAAVGLFMVLRAARSRPDGMPSTMKADDPGS